MSFRLVVGILLAAILVPPPVLAQAPPPAVSPDPLPDVPPTTGDPFPFFDNYSWRIFIALNWPAKAGAANRGQPDRTKSLSDDGPRVWSTWKSRYEVFQPNGATPAPWVSYEGSNPCGNGFANDVVTLSSFSAFSAFSDFNQAIFSLSKVGNALAAQNQTYARYEVRMNQLQFDSVIGNKWFLASNLPSPSNPMPFNTGSIEVKGAWRLLTAKDSPAVRSRYYVVPNAQVFDVASSKCVLQDIALVGFHIVSKTPDRPQWIWSTFEHVDNVPTPNIKPPTGTPFSFNDPAQPQTLNPAKRPPPISTANPPVATPTAMQVVRKQAITPQTMAMNQAYWNLPQIKGTRWQNYMLVATQWPTRIAPENPSNDGAPFPSGGSALSNTTMETYFQFDGGSCMDCHNLSNAQGRDFVMFVTMDAFRPNTPAPSESFVSKLNIPIASTTSAQLGADPMIKSLVDFFESTKDK